MRDPSNLMEVYYNGDKITTLPITSIPEYDIEDYDLFDDKDFKKYIDYIEKRIIRPSFEYKQLVSFLRTHMDMNKCSFYQNVNNIDTYKIKIHIHHDPITLYDICMAVYNKRCALRESLSEEMVAKEVMYLHYSLLVGLIPLAETVHELVHNQYLFVPTDKVMGKYREFVNMYEAYIEPEKLEILNRIEKLSEVYNSRTHLEVLDRNFIYLDFSGAYEIPKYEDVLQMMSNRINDKPEPVLRQSVIRNQPFRPF